MENPPAAAPAPHHRARRLGVVNPLTVAVGLALLTAGGAFGWRMGTGAPTARPTPAAAAAALALEPLPRGGVCDPRGEQAVREDVLRADEGAPRAGLGEYLPKRSPIPGYRRVSTRALDGAGDAEYFPGAVEARVATFRPEGDGGFDVYAYRFLTRQAAADVLAGNVVRRVCDHGATPLEARGRPGLVVLKESRQEWMSAWWTSGSDVVVVRYGGWGDADAALANLAAIAGTAALY